MSEADRDALLLRYIEKKSAPEMAALLGISEEAAQKRVTRAVDRLRELFSQRKLTIGAGSLVVLISANAVQAVPATYAATITTTALASTAATTSTVTAAATKTIAMTTLQKSLVTAVLATAVATGAYEARQASQLRGQAATLQQQLAPLTAQARQLQRERDTASNHLAGMAEEIAINQKNNLELLRLRNEVTMLKRQPLTQSPVSDDSWRVSTLKPAPTVAAKLLDEDSTTSPDCGFKIRPFYWAYNPPV